MDEKLNQSVYRTFIEVSELGLKDYWGRESLGLADMT